jgi:hypothetical protein
MGTQSSLSMAMSHPKMENRQPILHPLVRDPLAFPWNTIMVSAQYSGLDLELMGGLLEHDVFGDERNNTIRYKTASDRFSWEACNE